MYYFLLYLRIWAEIFDLIIRTINISLVCGGRGGCYYKVTQIKDYLYQL